jgi:hypothetical protein
VATVTLNRPEIHNAFDEALIAKLTETFVALDDDRDVRIVVLAGAGPQLLRRRRPELDEADGRVRPGRKPARCDGAGRDAPRRSMRCRSLRSPACMAPRTAAAWA